MKEKQNDRNIELLQFRFCSYFADAFALPYLIISLNPVPYFYDTYIQKHTLFINVNMSFYYDKTNEKNILLHWTITERTEDN